MTFNSDVFDDVLRARALSRNALSERLGLDRDKLDTELAREPTPRQGLLNEIAKELVVPSFIFFMEETPPLNEAIPDFRSAVTSISTNSRSTTKSIELAKAIQKTASDLGAKPAADLPVFQRAKNFDIEKFALETRKFFNITTEDQTSSRNDNEFYNICRRKIENKGIFVIHESFSEYDGSGFCLANDDYPIIVVNTKQQTRGRQLFTLVHELAHVLMNQTGISDPFSRNNEIERQCNLFACSFLVPREYISQLLRGLSPNREPDVEDVRQAAVRLRISQQATVLRLEELGYFVSGSHDKWLSAIHNVGNPDRFKKKGGPGNGPPPQEKVKLAKYGFRFASVFGELASNKLISEINLYRTTGLKPKYQKPLFDLSSSITEEEAKTLGLDDE